MKSIIKTVLISLLIIAAGAAGFAALKATKPVPPKKETEKIRPLVRVMEVEKGEYRAVIEESGNVEPKTSLEITSEVSGRITKVSENLQVGYFVKQGELLIEIDPREYRYSVAQYQAQIAQYEAEKSQLRQERKNLKRNIEVEEDKLELAKEELQRKKKLFESKSISESELDKQELEYKQIFVSLLNQRNALALLESREELIEAKIEATKAQLETANLKLEKTQIFAPFSGRISEESVETGEYVTAGQKLATMYDISAMEIVINISPRKMTRWISREESEKTFPEITDVAKVNEWVQKYGPKGEVVFRYGDETKTWPGKVTRLKGALDATTRTVPIVVEVKDPFKGVKPGHGPPLLPGMFVDVILQGRLLRDVAAIPRSAVQQDKVYVVEDGKLAIRDVKVEFLSRDTAIVSKGLKDGDKVILSSIPVAVPGTELRIAKK